MTTKTPERLSARDRLLAAAEQLFYEEGVNTVGIDRVIEHAGVAKASLYSAFGSKEELIRAYLQKRHDSRQARLQAYLARLSTPRDKLLGVFDFLAESGAQSNFRGCAFVRASAEAKPDGAVMAVCETVRAEMRALLTDLAREAGAADPAALARQLQLLYDGVSIAAQMDRDRGAAATARAAAAAMLDNAAKR